VVQLPIRSPETLLSLCFLLILPKILFNAMIDLNTFANFSKPLDFACASRTQNQGAWKNWRKCCDLNGFVLESLLESVFLVSL